MFRRLTAHVAISSFFVVALAGCAADTADDGQEPHEESTSDALTVTKTVQGMRALHLFQAMSRARLPDDYEMGTLYVSANKIRCETSQASITCHIRAAAGEPMYALGGTKGAAIADALAAVPGVTQYSNGIGTAIVTYVQCQADGPYFESVPPDRDAFCTMKVVR